MIKNNQKISVAILCGGPSLERGISLNSARSVMDHLGSLGVSIVFPCIHGTFGEDGEIQNLLEKYNIPFIGSASKSCKMAFDKHKANEYIRSLGFYAPNSIVLKITDSKKTITQKINKFWKGEKIKRAIVKPASGGSSIGVFSVEKTKDAIKSVEILFSKRMDTRVVMERFAEGKEFTVIILQNRFNMPVAILPTEIEVEYDKNQFFDFRKKYLPTRQVAYHCPPRFSNEIIEKIQIESEQLFSLFGMRDFARFDGFLMPDGNIWFSDFNPISGMEQNSFLFQQSSRIGFSHQDLLRYIVNNAFLRRSMNKEIENPLAVLFGGETAEKPTSLMSGTNVWLKLRGSEIYKPYPYLLGQDKEVWKLPYSYILNHTVEEIIKNAMKAKKDSVRLAFLVGKVKLRLALEKGDATEEFFMPKKLYLNDLIKEHPFIFLGLHGGIGENGTIQKILSDKKIKYKGSD